jgi:hypothetical protein
MKESYEDIRKLLEQFTSGQEAGQMTDDIRQADALLSSVPAANISQETLAAIQDKVRRRLAARQTRTVRFQTERYFAAVAAMILIAVLAFVFYDIHRRDMKTLPLIASKIWNDNLAADIELTNKFDQLTGQLDKVNQTGAQWLDENSNLAVEVDNLEAITMSTDFWKG